MSESARAEAFASQADRSRELAAGYVNQMIALLRAVRDLRDGTVQAIDTMQIPHRWNGTMLELYWDGEWQPGPDLAGVDGRGISSLAIVDGRVIVTYSDSETLDIGSAIGDVAGPSESVDGNLAAFIGTTGKAIEDGGVAVSTDGTLAGNSDAAIPTQKAVKTKIDALAATLGTASTKNTGTSSGNVPVLDGSGKLDASILPALAINDVFTVADEAAMLALTAQRGDIAVRSDENKSYILSTDDPATLADWVLLRASTELVLSVNGQTGAVLLDADDISDTSTTNKFASSARIASLINGATSKSTPVDADELALIDSAASNVLKKLTWANLKTTLIAAFKAAASNVWAGTSDVLFLTPKSVKDSSGWLTLTSGATPAWNTQSGVNARIVLDNNATFAAPTNLIDGWTYTLLIVQGTTGGTGAFNTIWDFGSGGTPTLSVGSGKRDLVVGVYDATTTKLISSFRKGA